MEKRNRRAITWILSISILTAFVPASANEALEPDGEGAWPVKAVEIAEGATVCAGDVCVQNSAPMVVMPKEQAQMIADALEKNATPLWKRVLKSPEFYLALGAFASSITLLIVEAK